MRHDKLPPVAARGFNATLPVNYLPQGRQAWSVVLDAAIAVATYLLAYRLRFAGDTLAVFLPGAWATSAIVASGQVIGVWLAGVYQERAIADKVRRLMVGAGIGTAAAVGIVWQMRGFTGLSRSSFAAAWFLFSMVAIGWRASRVLVDSRRRAVSAEPGDLVDRTVDQTTVAETVWAVFTFRELLKNLVLKDLKLKYRGSVLGFLWSLINPVAMILVYTLAFKVVMKGTQPNFLLFLLVGLLAWTFFASSLTMATGSIIDAGSLMKGVRFPRAILPLSTVFFNLAQYFLTVVVLVPILHVAYQIPPSAPMLLFPVVLALQVAFIAGLALMVAAATAFFRDVKHLLDIGLSMLFWTTPIVYPMSDVPERLRALFALSPMSPFVMLYRSVLYDGTWPELSVWVIAATYAVTSGALGLAAFLAVEDRLSEQM
jgi:lipopolysaccharide transport system permease protein